jgi:SAM-dependent methyltransferase
MTAIPETVALFDDWANQGRAEGMEEGHLPRALVALARIDVRAGDRILDLGCGNGWATRLLRQRAGDDGSAVGVDASVPMVERARVASAGARGLTFQRGVFETLQFDDASFDHVFSFEALYYSSDLSQSLAEIRRVLRPGGSLTIGTDHYLENEDSHSWSADLSVPMEMMSEAKWGERVRLAGFESVETFRCLDPRPVDPTWSAEKQTTVRRFRTVVGTLVIYAV